MFGMGMTLKTEDFLEIVKRPKPVLVGLLAQFTLMPLIAYLLTVIFNLDPLIAAVVAVSKATILDSGAIGFIVVALHNIVGYTLGYGISRLSGFTEKQRHAIMVEVGMQNSGLGAALPSAIFSV